jgi:hypothetical protein
MFSHNLAKNWNPYTVPATPNIPSGSSDVYSLSCEEGADSAKNPSQFLKWKLGLPKGDELGDTLYWDPAKGEGGGWVVLNPPSGSGVHVLASSGEAPYWLATEGC